MAKPPQKEEVTAAIERVTNRFWQLTADPQISSDGVTQIAVGLNALLDEVREQDGFPLSALKVAIDAFDRLADVLQQAPEPVTPADDTPTIDVHTDLSVRKFVDAFRGEAKKRLAGLSLSLTGVFNSDLRAIDQTVSHLHAIRGGAGMLGLQSIAALAGVMEDVILTTKRSGEERWPVRPLLRGFATLESAIEDPDSGYDNIIQAITDELRGHLSDITDRQPRHGFNEQPITDVRKEPLQKRILVVDDVETIAHSVGLILSELDIPIDVAHSGPEALEKLASKPYSLVISDVAMPGMNGLEVTRTIRRDESLSDLPVILLTALDREEERRAGFEAGASDYIVKGSIGGGELLSRVNELLQDAPVVPARANEERRFRKVLVAEDIETIAASIAFVLSEGPYEITLAHNGKEALERAREGDYELVISDLQMPMMDGYGLLESLKADPELAPIPVILLTSRDTTEERQKALDLGAAHYLIKGEVGGGKLLDIVGGFFDD